MKPAPFEYYRPTSVADALARLSAGGGAKILAGGQSLLPMMNLRLARPEVLVDAGPLKELDRVIVEESSLLFGALTTHRTLEHASVVRKHLPLLARAAGQIGHVGIRNRGTMAGSLAHADASAELPAVLTTLGASVFIEAHQRKRREIPVSALFEGLFETVLDEADMITWIRVPMQRVGSRYGFAEIARRPGDFAEAGCALAMQMDGDGRVESARMTLFGVADVPVQVDEVLGLRGFVPTEARFDELADQVVPSLEPLEEPDYRRRLAAVCIRQAGRHSLSAQGLVSAEGSAHG